MVRYRHSIPKNQNKRGARRARQNKTPLKVISMTAAQAFNERVAQHSDSMTLRGKVLLSATISPSTTNFLVLSPSSTGFGVRVNAMAAVFSRYRIKRLGFKFSTGTSSPVALGIQDDTSSGVTIPTTYNGILEQRCSASNLSAVDVVEFAWEPLDKKAWYYTLPIAGDLRTSTMGTAFASAQIANTNLYCEIDYTFVFSGAVDAGAL
jgi:hypothetical protein